MSVVPFSTETYEGFAEVKGLVRLSDDSLFFEFQTTDGIVGFFKSATQEIEVPVTDVVTIDLEGRFRLHLQLQVRRMDLLGKLPNDGGGVKLRIARKHRELADELVSDIRLRLSEQKYDRVLQESKEFDDQLSGSE